MLYILRWPSLKWEWVGTICTYQSGFSEECSKKQLIHCLNQAKSADWLKSLGVVFHNFIPLNIRTFWNFTLVYLGSTSLLLILDLVSCTCAITWLSIFRVECSRLRSLIVLYVLRRTKQSYTTSNWKKFELISNFELIYWSVIKVIALDISQSIRRVVELNAVPHAVIA